jgi:hypothetical protein
VGDADGSLVGWDERKDVGEKVGIAEGEKVGVNEGIKEGKKSVGGWARDGKTEGCLVGIRDGGVEGESVGVTDGSTRKLFE